MIDAANDEASALVRRGLALLQPGEHGRTAAADAEACTSALECFDRALAIRLRLPFERSPRLRYDLAGTWLNRGVVLAAQGTSGPNGAIAAYAAAVRLLETLPLDEDARFPRRLAIAHQNRGRAFQARAGSSRADAVGAFHEALAVLDRPAAQAIADRGYLQATAWASVADAEASDGCAPSCRRAIAAATKALEIVAPTEEEDPQAALVGLQARHACCRAIARCLPPHCDPAAVSPDDVHLATDMADEGLSMARHWLQRGLTQVTPLAADLFQFGAAVYARYQPHFLQDFINEHRALATGAVADVLPG